MGKVVPIVDPDVAEFKHCSYFEVDGDFGIATKDKAIALVMVNRNEFEVLIDGYSLLFDREALAEFLHLAALNIDPDNKWMPRGKIICSDY